MGGSIQLVDIENFVNFLENGYIFYYIVVSFYFMDMGYGIFKIDIVMVQGIVVWLSNVYKVN